MNIYRFHHNGSVVTYFDNLKKCAAAIKAVIDQHKELEPKLIMNYQQGNKTVIIYQYWTNYIEMFLIEEIEKGG